LHHGHPYHGEQRNEAEHAAVVEGLCIPRNKRCKPKTTVKVEKREEGASSIEDVKNAQIGGFTSK
jgi:hypothetical protein